MMGRFAADHRVALMAGLATVVFHALPILAQPAADPVKFDVASVKPCKAEVSGRAGGDGGGSTAGTASPGHLDLRCRTLADLIQMAYVRFADGKRTVPGRRVPTSGGPAWIDSDRYDIDARAGNAPGQAVMSGPMMQALLASRFKLQIHRETREVPVFELIAAKTGVTLPVAQPGRCMVVDPDHPSPRPAQGQPLARCGMFSRSSVNGATDVFGTTMENLCRQFSVLLGREVIDRTGLAGTFDIQLELYPGDLRAGSAGNQTPGVGDGAEAAADPASGIIDVAAIQQAVRKIGLKLNAAKGAGEVLVIDHADRASEN